MKTGLMVLLLFSLLVGLVSATATNLPPQAEWGILFTADTGLYWMRPDGTDIQEVFNLTERETDLLVRPVGVLSPDGEQVVITFSDVTSAYRRFNLLNRRTQTISRLTREASENKTFYWSPDSKRIAYISEALGGKLYIINLETGAEKLITLANAVGDTYSLSYFMSLDWSPNGQNMVVSYIRRDGLVNSGEITILLIDTATGDMSRILHTDNWGFAPAWGNDTMIYYVCQSAERLVRLCAVDIQRRLSVPIRDLTADLPNQGYISKLDVAPDGRIVLGFNDSSGRDLMYLFDLEQPQLTNLTAITGMRGMQPTWFQHQS